MSIGLPLEAHLLPGHGRHQSVIHPFFYMADSDNIFDLMVSIACQRHVLGTSQPAIGLEISDSNSTVKLVLSWVDSATHAVHVVSPEPLSAVGVFDLNDVVAAVSFAQFVIGLSDEIAGLRRFISTACITDEFYWRADNAPFPNVGSLQDRVKEWSHGVAQPSHPYAKIAAVNDLTHWNASQDGSEVDITSPSFRSLGLSANGYDELDDITTWAFCRNIYLFGLIELPNDAEHSAEINAHIASYHRMCGHSWPASWNYQNEPFSFVGPFHDAVCKLLQVAWAQKVSLMCPEHEAQDWTEPNLGQTHSRNDWDSLLYHFYVAGDEKTSPYILLDQRIVLVRNAVAEHWEEHDVAALNARARAYAIHCSAAHLPACLMGGEVGSQAIRASRQAIHLLKRLVDESEDSLKSLKPQEMICDVILTMPHPGCSSIGHNFAESRTGISNNPSALMMDPDAIAQCGAAVDHSSFLPHALVQHRSASEEMAHAVDRGRMSLASVVAFYSALGVEDHPFYCLVTTGKLGFVLMAWKSSQSRLVMRSKQQTIFLMDRNLAVFDISIPFGTSSFAAFLLRLRDDQMVLKSRLETAGTELSRQSMYVQ
ncbi:hypothetical protein R3P38DRAFT_3422496 [Favolaschia claudopus]|uniref:Uncharacterized protein n=1 Tax=Favolaschia claudopus TaxID=2862362 RepID=A0AAW0D742_9AGAR